MDLADHIVILKSGEEKLLVNDQPTNFSLLEFWRWSASDILSNATRGIFAEFIVASALGIVTSRVRNEWDAFDLISNDNTKIEVKSCAYLQSWQQVKYSDIKFSTKAAKGWHSEIDKRSSISQRSADIYVFCLLKHKEKTTVNPLDMNQWDFYIISTKQLNECIGDQKSISLNSLTRICSAVSYSEIANQISLINIK